MYPSELPEGTRPAVVAGQFYPGDPAQLAAAVRALLRQPQTPEEPARGALLAMAPHAGYVYSGAVAGQTLAGARLPRTVLLLGPNHTGRGAPLAVWDQGAWETPLGLVSVNKDLAQRLLADEPRLTADADAHLGEHSLEVELPFLQVLNPNVSVVPIAVAEPGLDVLLEVGSTIGRTLSGWPENVSIVVSSDMSHYVSHEEASRLDSVALERVLALDPDGLYNAVRGLGISMCGVLPMTVGLAAAQEMGAAKADLVAYATSGQVSGDYTQVVGYAGVLVS